MEEARTYRGIILDLDGVITDTRSLHFEAWAQTLNSYLAQLEETPFDEKDYQTYVDGKPREEGLSSFFSGRRLELSPELLNKLSEMKDKNYLSRLRQKGPDTFADTLGALNSWRRLGIPLAVVTSSKNGDEVLKKLHLENFFKVKIDGVLGDKLHLKGKPSADYFVEAAKGLGLSPEECAVVEDSLSGVEAARAGDFASVIGIVRPGQTEGSVLLEHGAHEVVSSLSQIHLDFKNAILAFEEIKEIIGTKEVAIFLDFDGTMSEIVPDYTQAVIGNELRETLGKCSSALKMAVVSGRNRGDVKERVGGENLFYAGCHGFDISGPGCFHFQIEEALQSLPQLHRATEEVRNLLSYIEGVQLEEKKFFTAIHFRQADAKFEEEIKKAVEDTVHKYDLLTCKSGKKVFELAPNVEWGKGKAIRKLCEILEINPNNSVAIYLGDDATDEDGFCELKGQGIGIFVSDRDEKKTSADYWLKNPSEVKTFLDLICQQYGSSEKAWRHGS